MRAREGTVTWLWMFSTPHTQGHQVQVWRSPSEARIFPQNWHNRLFTSSIQYLAFLNYTETVFQLPLPGTQRFFVIDKSKEIIVKCIHQRSSILSMQRCLINYWEIIIWKKNGKIFDNSKSMKSFISEQIWTVFKFTSNKIDVLYWQNWQSKLYYDLLSKCMFFR